MEQQLVYDMFDFDDPKGLYTSATPSPGGPMTNFQVAANRITAYLCPSDPQGGELCAFGGGQNGTDPKEDFRQTNMGGIGDPVDHTCDGDWMTEKFPKIAGVMGNVEGCKIDDISDGTSSTFMIGETTGGGPGTFLGATWAYSDVMNMRDGINGPFTVPGGLLSAGSLAYLVVAPSSYHPGGCHFLMADGSVQFISQDTSSGVLYSFATRAGGETIAAEN